MSMPDGATPGLDNDPVGGATLSDSGAGADTSTSAAPPDTTSSDAGSEVTYNPAWKDILETIPEQFKPIVTPKLKEWDRSYGALAEKFAPFKKFSESNVRPENIEAAMSLYDLANANPQELYRRLEYALRASGQLPQHQPGNQQQEELEPDQGNVQEQQQVGNQPPADPRFDQMQQQMQFIQQQNEQLQHEILTTRYKAQIDSEVDALIKQHGQFDVADVMNRFTAQLNRGENDASIQKAFAEQQAYNQRWLTAKQAPPSVISPNGGMPSAGQNLDLNNQDERLAAVKAIIAATSGS